MPFIGQRILLGVTRFENLAVDFELTGINQIWVSDITYYQYRGIHSTI